MCLKPLPRQNVDQMPLQETDSSTVWTHPRSGSCHLPSSHPSSMDHGASLGECQHTSREAKLPTQLQRKLASFGAPYNKGLSPFHSKFTMLLLGVCFALRQRVLLWCALNSLCPGGGVPHLTVFKLGGGSQHELYMFISAHQNASRQVHLRQPNPDACS